jgi:hypothetical protein
MIGNGKGEIGPANRALCLPEILESEHAAFLEIVAIDEQQGFAVLIHMDGMAPPDFLDDGQRLAHTKL